MGINRRNHLSFIAAFLHVKRQLVARIADQSRSDLMTPRFVETPGTQRLCGSG